MPYLTLGKTNINYSNKTDQFIITMILDTTCSYQYPILVRDTPTLDIYFGKRSIYRDFLNEMIKSGVTLNLYKPIQKLGDKISWIDEIENLRNQGVPDDLIQLDDPSSMPSNLVIPENSKSWNNRDTIRLFNSKQHNGFSFNYCYPEYEKDYKYYKKDGSEYYLGLGGAENSISNYQLDEGYETLAFKLNFSKVTIEDLKDKYLVIPYLGYNYMIWFKSSSEPPSIANIKSSITIQLLNKDKSAVVQELIDMLERSYSLKEPYGLGYDVILDSDLDNSSFTISKKRSTGYVGIDELKVNLQSPEKNYKYTNIPNLVFDSDFRRTNDILSEATEPIKQLEFYSKIIGKDNDENIKVTITRLIDEPYEYRIVVTKYDYEEYFEVNISDSYKNNNAPLVSTINRNSKLVSCRLFDRVTSLPEGTFYLRGAYVENYTYEERRQALDIIKESEINDDVLIIDDLEEWKSDATITCEDLKLFLDYSIYKDNQTFITNRSHRTTDPLTGGTNVYHEHRYNITDKDRWVQGLLTVRNNLFCNIDVILNVGDISELISDKQNRLVYFYGDMLLLKSYRPGCYVFLKGLLTDNYSVESEYIIYNPPRNNIIDELSEHKSNYMSFNNHYYYYPRYQNGSTSKITTVTRFIVSKIGREFKRNKWRIINAPVYERTQVIDKIIRDALTRFSIIRSLSIDNIDVNDNIMTIKVVSKINELTVKDIQINITLNYT